MWYISKTSNANKNKAPASRILKYGGRTVGLENSGVIQPTFIFRAMSINIAESFSYSQTQGLPIQHHLSTVPPGIHHTSCTKSSCEYNFPEGIKYFGPECQKLRKCNVNTRTNRTKAMWPHQLDRFIKVTADLPP